MLFNSFLFHNRSTILRHFSSRWKANIILTNEKQNPTFACTNFPSPCFGWFLSPLALITIGRWLFGLPMQVNDNRALFWSLKMNTYQICPIRLVWFFGWLQGRVCLNFFLHETDIGKCWLNNAIQKQRPLELSKKKNFCSLIVKTLDQRWKPTCLSEPMS